MTAMNVDRENYYYSPEALTADVCLSYNLCRPLDTTSGAGARLLADPDLARDARTMLLKKDIRRAMSLACLFSVVEDELDFSRVDEIDAAANILVEAVDALRARIGAEAAATALEAVATCMHSDYLSEDVLQIVDNVRYGFPPFGNR